MVIFNFNSTTKKRVAFLLTVGKVLCNLGEQLGTWKKSVSIPHEA